MVQFFIGIFDRLFAVFGAFIFSQIPHFMVHYEQQLIGHVNELRLHVNQIEQAALQSGKTIQEYIQKFLQSQDVDFHYQGELMQAMQERLHLLNLSLMDLTQVSSFFKPFVFIKVLHPTIFFSSFHTFTFGISLSVEEIVYALIGMCFGLFLFYLLKKGGTIITSLVKIPFQKTGVSVHK